MAFPRVMRNRRRVEDMERHLEETMLKKFKGLTQDQREAILRIVDQNSKVRRDVRRIIYEHDQQGEDTDPSEQEQVLDDDVDFPIVEAHLQSVEERQKEEELSKQTHTHDGPDSVVGKQDVCTNPVQKYSQLIDRRKHGSAHLPTNDTVRANNQAEALAEMKQVTQDLKSWVQSTLDTPTVFDPTGPLGANPTPIEPSDTQRPVDIEGFDILLNACKPSILEAKPSVRLNIVREANPPEALLQSLRENLGLQIGKDKRRSGSPRRRQRGMEGQGAVSQEDARRIREKYGAWYVRPAMWNEFMRKNEEDAKSKNYDASSSRRFGGIVQTKLDEILANRAREDAHLTPITLGSGAAPAATGSSARPNARTRGSQSVVTDDPERI
ncbi:hypothetical protein SpCBS45565_g06746 [Spizellomyces sp. 'palustris']|nr:hypothetical protein SpCBS45565_g06746 [Spizellomyces sp. 'palustris']